MSVKIWSLCWEVDLSSSEKFVLMRLADFADDRGRSIFPSVQRVAHDCGMSERTVQGNLRKLLARGILLRIAAGGGRGRAAEYAINLDRLSPSRVRNGENSAGFNGTSRSVKDANSAGFSAQNGEDAAGIADGKGANSAGIADGKGESNDIKGADSAPHPSESVSKEAERDARAHACEAIRIIEAFDAERIAVYGPDQERSYPDATDRVYAERWIAQGADVALCRSVFAALQRRLFAEHRGPVRTLKYCDQKIRDALTVRNAPVAEGTSCNVEYLHNARSRKSEHGGGGSSAEARRRGILDGLADKLALDSGRAAPE